MEQIPFLVADGRNVPIQSVTITTGKVEASRKFELPSVIIVVTEVTLRSPIPQFILIASGHLLYLVPALLSSPRDTYSI